MSTVNGKKLSFAVMHQNIFYPGIGDIRKELSCEDTGLSRGVKMTIDEPFVLVETKTKAGQAVTIPVPITNFSHLVLARE
jgi:hypothetical protein